MATPTKRPRVKKTIPDLPQHMVALCFGKSCTDTMPTAVTMTFAELAAFLQ
jgi:hypothetical protein